MKAMKVSSLIFMAFYIMVFCPECVQIEEKEVKMRDIVLDKENWSFISRQRSSFWATATTFVYYPYLPMSMEMSFLKMDASVCVCVAKLTKLTCKCRVDNELFANLQIPSYQMCVAFSGKKSSCPDKGDGRHKKNCLKLEFV